MDLRINPGPLSGDLLFLHSEHRAYNLFHDEDYADRKALNVRRGDQNLWHYLRNNDLHPRVKQILNEAGFGGLIDCGYRKVDHGLITALVERWRPETHTFHLTVGEATVTLQDVNVLWGLPVEGEPVTGIDLAFNQTELMNRCEILLGITPLNSDIDGGRLKLLCLYDKLVEDFPDEPSDLECNQLARVIILYLCGGTLFPDSTNNMVPLLYLNNLEDLSACGGYSWGSAVLSCLYRNLCKATNPGAKEISGPVYLLQIWALERFLNLAPSVHSQYSYGQPIGYRWFSNLSYRETPSHVLKAYRSSLQSLREDQFVWTPYSTIIHRLPQICRSGEDSWTSDCFLILWDVVEPHLPSRVMRQFGMVQGIPDPIPITPDQHRTIHKSNRGGKRSKDWSHHHAQYISSWNSRHENTFEVQPGMTPTVSDEYMRWYRSRTVLYITNLGSQHINPHGL